MADDTCKETVRIWKENGEDVVKKFKYKLPFDWNFCYLQAVDYHNNLSHALPSIEDTWINDWWECRLFAFILAISEVNTFLILRYFDYCVLYSEGMPMLLEFHQKLSWKLINNIYIGKYDGGFDFFPESIHRFMTAPRHTKRYHNWR